MALPEEAWDEMDCRWPPNPKASKIKLPERLEKLLAEADEKEKARSAKRLPAADE